MLALILACRVKHSLLPFRNLTGLLADQESTDDADTLRLILNLPKTF
jgi:hypothetical protein